MRAHLPLHPEILEILLALEDEQRHGYGIVKRVEERTEGTVQLAPSLLYRRLKRLLEQDLVEEAERRRASDLGDRRRRYYRLTELGRAVLAAEARRLTELVSDRGFRALSRDDATA